MDVFGAQRFAPKPIAKCPTNIRFLWSRHGMTKQLYSIVDNSELVSCEESTLAYTHWRELAAVARHSNEVSVAKRVFG